MGTVGYMSPEQASGQAGRFPFRPVLASGSILYEMATGKRAFQRGTASRDADGDHPRSEPEPVAARQPEGPGAVSLDRRALPRQGPRRALRLDARPRARPEERAGAHLGSLRLGRDRLRSRLRAAARRDWSPAEPRCLSAGLIAGVSLGRALEQGRAALLPAAHLPARRDPLGALRAGRPDGRSTRPPGTASPWRSSSARPESPESRPLGLAGAPSFWPFRPPARWPSRSTGAPRRFHPYRTLASTSIAGGAAPREILEDVQWADWAPDGKELAIVRDAAGRNRLEFPIGKVALRDDRLDQSSSVSRSGDLVAFCDHPAARRRRDRWPSWTGRARKGRSRAVLDTPGACLVTRTAARSGSRRRRSGATDPSMP